MVSPDIPEAESLPLSLLAYLALHTRPVVIVQCLVGPVVSFGGAKGIFPL